MDVKPFYQGASVVLMTSEYEGYPLVLLESKQFGIPCVMYDLPYLSLCDGYRGIIPVKMNDTKGAANAIVDLLTDDGMCKKLANDARMHYEELKSFDFAEKWETVFSSIGSVSTESVLKESKIMIATLLAHHQQGAEKTNGIIIKPRNRYLRMIQGGIQCVDDHGIIYTIGLALKKIYNKIKRG